MNRFWEILSSPGAKGEVVGIAPTQQVEIAEDNEKASPTASDDNIEGLDVTPKHRMLDRWLDNVVKASGSEIVSSTILLGLVAWAFLGIPFHDNVDWQVLISDVQAILSYIFDSLLMRQQLNSYDEALAAAAKLRSRANSHARMLQTVIAKLEIGELTSAAEAKGQTQSEFQAELPKENRLGRFTTRFSLALGHIATIIIYWTTIIIWLGFGHANGWSNTWQLYMNSATSALMIFVFAFLANVRERHSEYAKICLDATFIIDSALERKLKSVTGDDVGNDVVVIPAPKVNLLQRAIYYYADVVGTLIGVLLLIIVMIVWVAIGPVFQFQSNWWLLIGTYAGLVGLNDGFVLRNVQAKLHDHENAQFKEVESNDDKLFAIIGQAIPEKEVIMNDSTSCRMSAAVNRVCAHELSVIFDIFIIVGLLVGSSVMRWNLTGQLLCNIPPSIIESFLMVVLITGHNFADAERRVQMRSLYERRLKFIAFVNAIAVTKTTPVVNA